MDNAVLEHFSMYPLWRLPIVMNTWPWNGTWYMLSYN